MRYNIDIEIVNPENVKISKTLKLQANFAKTDSGYGNDTYVHIASRDGGNTEYNYDLRYDASFHKNLAEVWLAHWIYTNWSGENMSYDVKSLTITRDQRVKK